MNITLSADEKLIRSAREYARKHNTTINNMVREYLFQVVHNSDYTQLAEEFAENAIRFSGKSDQDFKFNRDSIYNRDE